jgi:hypothetical protein
VGRDRRPDVPRPSPHPGIARLQQVAQPGGVDRVPVGTVDFLASQPARSSRPRQSSPRRGSRPGDVTLRSGLPLHGGSEPSAVGTAAAAGRSAGCRRYGNSVSSPMAARSGVTPSSTEDCIGGWPDVIGACSGQAERAPRIGVGSGAGRPGRRRAGRRRGLVMDQRLPQLLCSPAPLAALEISCASR